MRRCRGIPAANPPISALRAGREWFRTPEDRRRRRPARADAAGEIRPGWHRRPGSGRGTRSRPPALLRTDRWMRRPGAAAGRRDSIPTPRNHRVRHAPAPPRCASILPPRPVQCRGARSLRSWLGRWRWLRHRRRRESSQGAPRGSCPAARSGTSPTTGRLGGPHRGIRVPWPAPRPESSGGSGSRKVWIGSCMIGRVRPKLRSYSAGRLPAESVRTVICSALRPSRTSIRTCSRSCTAIWMQAQVIAMFPKRPGWRAWSMSATPRSWPKHGATDPAILIVPAKLSGCLDAVDRRRQLLLFSAKHLHGHGGVC